MLKTLVPFVLLVFASGPIGGWGKVPVWVTVLAWLGVAALAAMIARSWKVGVYVEPGGIDVVGFASRTYLEWSEISDFAFGNPDARFWKWAPVVVRADGLRIPMNAIQAPQPWTRPTNKFDQRAVAKLEELLERSRESGGTVSPDELVFERRFGY
ncbi:MAG: hypothetical protein JHC98_01540 [Thermoleophilaceae bacterium]|nr:hypothetical protein [Thermoleophilaceae bacterium]